MPITAEDTAIATAAAATGPIGDAVAAVYLGIKALGISFPGATQHLTWDEANTIAISCTDKIVPLIVQAANDDSATLSSIKVNLSSRMIDFYQTSGWWEMSTAASFTHDETDRETRHPDWTSKKLIWDTIWRYHVWVFGNVDRSSFEGASARLNEIAAQVLIPALASVNIASIELPTTPGTKEEILAAATGATTTGATTTGATTTGAATSLSAISWLGIAVVLAVLAAMFLWKGKKP